MESRHEKICDFLQPESRIWTRSRIGVRDDARVKPVLDMTQDPG
ncbi:MAG: hypothetical protein ACQEQX_09340 [Thermodesulfobacteriota bacterium]